MEPSKLKIEKEIQGIWISFFVFKAILLKGHA